MSTTKNLQPSAWQVAPNRSVQQLTTTGWGG